MKKFLRLDLHAPEKEIPADGGDLFFGGQGGIRTHEPLARLPDFESGPL